MASNWTPHKAHAEPENEATFSSTARPGLRTQSFAGVSEPVEHNVKQRAKIFGAPQREWSGKKQTPAFGNDDETGSNTRRDNWFLMGQYGNQCQLPLHTCLSLSHLFGSDPLQWDPGQATVVVNWLCHKHRSNYLIKKKPKAWIDRKEEKLVGENNRAIQKLSDVDKLINGLVPKLPWEVQLHPARLILRGDPKRADRKS